MNIIYAKGRLFIAIGVISIIYAGCFIFDLSVWVGHIGLILVGAVSIWEYYVIQQSLSQILVSREVLNQLSLGDIQPIQYQVYNQSRWDLSVILIDELPEQFQVRDFELTFTINAGDFYSSKYEIKPTLRGRYEFGHVHLYISSRFFNLIELRKSFDVQKVVEVYPSIIQMKKYELETFNQVATMSGIKRVRRIGQNDEFEHIRSYTPGDNIASINWKATSRQQSLLINQYQDTRSQSVFCIIDKGRSMKMPFQEMSLLDYAINSTLVLSNIILKKYDKAGLITFNDTLSSVVYADNKSGQLSRITRTLYNESTGFKESNFKSLYFNIRKKIRRRSILILFSNFEHPYDMRRALPYLRRLNKLHLLVVIFFTNTELIKEVEKKVENTKDIYATTFAQKSLIEKDRIAEELRIQGVKVILSTPEQLSINVINKYLEIKAKRMR